MWPLHWGRELGGHKQAPENGMGAGGGGSLLVSIIQDISSQALAPQKGQHLFPGLVLRWSCHARPLANPAHSAQVTNSLLTCLLHACSPTGPSGPSKGAQVRGQGVRCYCPLLAFFRIFHGLYSSISSMAQSCPTLCNPMD